tara:strand:+ start:363 stop:842 length:480 start_codon:yes stop_codon:yes gene_type:complete
MDVDGVLTNGKLLYYNSDCIGRLYDSKDGMAIRLLQHNDIKIAWISGSYSQSIRKRAEDLNIEMCYTLIKNKREVLEKIQSENNISRDQTIFLGDDINDLVVKPICKLFLCPKDSNNMIKEKADWIGKKSGGDGFVREVVDNLLSSLGVEKEHGWANIN